MKISLVTGNPDSATFNLMSPVATELRNFGHEVQVFEGLALGEADYDVVHLPFVGLALAARRAGVSIPMTVHVHHIEVSKEEEFCKKLQEAVPKRIVVCTPFWQERLGQLGFYNVDVIPQSFDYNKFPILPWPKEFTVGILGTDYPYKRFDVVRQVCKEMEIPLVDQTHKIESRGQRIILAPWLPNVLDFYQRIACYANVAFMEGGPLPPQEALLCGRFVVSVPAGRMTHIKTPEVLHISGSAESLRDGLATARVRFQRMGHPPSVGNILPSNEDVARMYAAVFRRAIS